MNGEPDYLKWMMEIIISFQFLTFLLQISEAFSLASSSKRITTFYLRFVIFTSDIGPDHLIVLKHNTNN